MAPHFSPSTTSSHSLPTLTPPLPPSSPVTTFDYLGVDIFTFPMGIATGFLQFNIAGPASVDGPAFITIDVGGLSLIKDLGHNKILNPAGLEK